MSEDVKSKLSELEKELYSKDFKQHRIEDVIPRKEIAISPSWDTEGDVKSMRQDEIEKLSHRKLMKKFVKYSAFLFFIAVVVAVFIWWRGSNIVSGGNIPIEIAAPVSIPSGEPFETKFTITNNNKVAIETSALLIEYPVGFYSLPNMTEIQRMSKNLGVIGSGQSVTIGVNTVLYGEEGAIKDAQVSLEYRMAGSNATLRKTATYSVRISSSPVNIRLLMPKEVSSGQEAEFYMDVVSNSKDTIEELLVEATYPTGFSFQSSAPVPAYGENVWKISGLGPQEKRTIKILGVIEGQEGDEKVIKIFVGTKNPKDERAIGIIYNSINEFSLITKPIFTLDLSVNNNKSQNSVTSFGKGVRVDVSWQNNGSVKVNDAVIEVKLNGAALDKYSIYAAGGGYYRSVDNTIVWDKTVNNNLASIEPGSSGSLSFSFSPVAYVSGTERLIKNPQIIFNVKASANRAGSASQSESISTFLTRSVKFETDLKVGGKGLFFTGLFQNIGPIPPQADKVTTYTILLSARNSSNNVSNAVVKTTLPIYVEWLNVVSPEGESIVFNDITREISWNVGRVIAGGFREVSFQISFTPSLSHINLSPMLTGDITISAMDDFTKTEVRDKKPALTTYISSDPQFSPNDANVVN